ncbi:Uncharacterized protein APZ42_033862 [Daphnia magna]|uniref:Transmembrane protein n=1 Tax=Daphnia magna TaxID=35525 RepID=A0A164KMT4_9CRUS|nr:Uncharacterized protein APZ42_033862 [Daphnia magna]
MLRVDESHGQQFFPCRCVDVGVGFRRTLIRFLLNSFMILILILFCFLFRFCVEDCLLLGLVFRF